MNLAAHLDVRNFWRLFLAKNDEGKWLNYGAVRFMTRQELEKSGHRQLGTFWCLDDPRALGADFQPLPNCIHLLVVAPPARVMLSPPLNMLVITAMEFGRLPQEEEMPNMDGLRKGMCISIDTITSLVPTAWSLQPEKLYIRQEIVMVWRVFKQHFHDRFDHLVDDDSDAGANKKQLVLVGSPGVGKTTLLLLMCLYVAVKLRDRVVLINKSDRHDPSVHLLLGDDGRCYSWEELPLSDCGSTRETAYDKFCEIAKLAGCGLSAKRRVWLCADLLFEEEVRTRLPGIRFDLLVPPDTLKTVENNTKQCQVPVWSEAGVKAASKKMGMWRETCNCRYRNSGGNLHWFDEGHDYAAEGVYTAVVRISSAMERGRSDRS